ncbi:MAG: AMP-binding protein, partial [Solirubrobacteraceae bacterium]
MRALPRLGMPSTVGALGDWSVRSLAIARDALALSRVGMLEVATHRAPYAVAGRGAEYRLRRYFPDEPPTGTPVLLVAPLVLTGDVWDLSRDVSAVRRLAERGVDPWVVELSPPREDVDDVEGMLVRRVEAVSAAIDDVIAGTGRSVHVVGHSQGGLLAYLATAHRRSQGVAAVVALGAPVDPAHAMGIPEHATAATVVAEVAALLELGVRIPGWAGRRVLKVVDPGRAAQRRVDFVVRLSGRDGRLPREGSRHLLQSGRSLGFPGPALVDAGRRFAAQNAVLAGPLTVGGDPVSLANLTVPVLAFDGSGDAIAPAASVRPIARSAPGAQVWGSTVNTGHLGLVAGPRADQEVWPLVADWIHWIDGEAPRPGSLQSLSEGPADEGPAGIGLGAGGQSLVEATVDAARLLATGTARTARTIRSLGEEAVEQLPRLSLLQQVRPGTRGSLALLLDEQAERDPERSQFLFDDRVHTRAEAKYRFDAVTHGLISLGVRRGEHVGVLMRSRPSAIAVTVALNRMGAVAVFLRPEGDTELEASLGRVERIVCAPDLLGAARAIGLPVAVLGSGGGHDRAFPDGVVDMERIDAQAVVPPAWYRPNPGQARDLAFILFTGDGAGLRVNRVTNGRWLLSALGTASAASLTVEDTVYCLTPPSHPSGLLVGLGGAIAGGSRIAMASRYDVDTFWAEVRRYGATVVTYTWTMLRELVDAPHHRGEEQHPVRLFVGSWMPPDLWRRVLKRFAPARVVEFYSAADTHGVLVNLG